MNGAVRAFGQRFAQNLLRPRGACGNYHYLAAVLLFLAERLFERKGVGLIDLVGDVFADLGAGFVEFERCILLRHLFHADQNLHALS